MAKEICLESLIKQLYSALVLPDGFSPFFSHFVQQFNLRSGGVLMVNQATKETRAIWCEGLSLSDLSTFQTHYEHIDPLVEQLTQSPPGCFCYLGLQESRQIQMSQPDYYQQWLEPLDIQYAAGAVLGADQQWISQLFFQRRANQGDFTVEERLTLQQLLPHIQHALHLYHLKVDQDKSHLLSQLLFDQIQLPVLLVDQHGNVCHQNAKASLYLEKTASLKVLNRRIHWHSAQKTEAISQAITQSIEGEKVETLQLTSSHMMPVIITITPLLATDVTADKGAAVFIYNSDNKPTMDPQALMALFQLSKSEANVSCGLIDGLSPAEIAERHYLSQETVRTYIKRIMKKTDTSRQSELVAKLIASPAYYAASSLSID
ncbi:helix-turn-helix transcriptional regulator [Photobacterium atrarenae]|uniref:Helix-turn-helix transcriptional regulator n=1 Tax=Photobacterium atrarenae TaxID=865757 RepID=A0ABY5GM55_9GAMM|nr:helix-turn-helix transcriptional regulator [Photobacterium atrarenae]UTV30409.1 helix-turn-helix transcriptional regulator [Photobacterium atrarenae]